MMNSWCRFVWSSMSASLRGLLVLAVVVALCSCAVQGRLAAHAIALWLKAGAVALCPHQFPLHNQPEASVQHNSTSNVQQPGDKHLARLPNLNSTEHMPTGHDKMQTGSTNSDTYLKTHQKQSYSTALVCDTTREHQNKNKASVNTPTALFNCQCQAQPRALLPLALLPPKPLPLPVLPPALGTRACGPSSAHAGNGHCSNAPGGNPSKCSMSCGQPPWSSLTAPGR